MKRNRSTLLGASLAALTMLIFVVGCSTSNPVAPQRSDIQYDNPQNSDTFPWGDTGDQTEIGERDDVTFESVDKATPDVVLYEEGTPIHIDAVRFDNLRID